MKFVNTNEQERVSSYDDQSCSGCWSALTDILSYKATALRNFKRKKDRIISRRSLLGKKRGKANTTEATLHVLAQVLWGSDWKAAISRQNMTGVALCHGVFITDDCNSSSSQCNQTKLYAGLAKQGANLTLNMANCESDIISACDSVLVPPPKGQTPLETE